MTDKARELLKKALNRWDDCEDISDSYLVGNVMEEIRAYLASEPEFVRLSEEEVSQILSSAHTPYEAVCATENRLVEKNK